MRLATVENFCDWQLQPNLSITCVNLVRDLIKLTMVVGTPCTSMIVLQHSPPGR